MIPHVVPGKTPFHISLSTLARSGAVILPPAPWRPIHDYWHVKREVRIGKERQIVGLEALFSPEPDARRPREDTLACNLKRGIFGVFDGMSSPFLGSIPRFKSKLTAKLMSIGQVSAWYGAYAVATASQSDSLASIVQRANHLIHDFHIERAKVDHTVDIKDPATLGGAKGALVQCAAGEIVVCQWGDVGVQVLLRNGSIVTSENQQLHHDFIGAAQHIDILGRNPDNRAAAWAEYIPLWKERLRRNSNSVHYDLACGGEMGFTEMNGSPHFPLGSRKGLFYQRFRLPEVAAVLLFSDGLVALPAMADMQAVGAKHFQALGETYGLKELLTQRRREIDGELRRREMSHIPSYPETTAILLRFPH